MRIFFPLILNIIFINSVAFTQGPGLEVNLPEDYGFKTEINGNLVVEQEFMGIRYNTQMEINSVLNLQVLGLDSISDYILEASYEIMNIRVTSILVNMEVNSEIFTPGDSLSSSLHALKGKKFQMRMSRKGEMTEISGLDEMISETISKSHLPAGQKSEFTRNLIQTVGKEALMDNYRSNRSFYPDHFSWNSGHWDFKMDIIKSGIPMELNSQISIKENSKKLILLSSDGRISLQSDMKPSADTQAPDLVNKLSGSEIAEVKIEPKTGLILESVVSQNIRGSILPPGEEKDEQESLIPFKIISRIQVITTPQE